MGVWQQWFYTNGQVTKLVTGVLTLNIPSENTKKIEIQVSEAVYWKSTKTVNCY